MRRVFSGFDWDFGNTAKCQKHGVRRSQIEELFLGQFAFGPDEGHSLLEERFFAVGKTKSGRHLIVIFTFREKKNDLLLRPISARFMHKKEVEKYEKEIAETKE